MYERVKVKHFWRSFSIILIITIANVSYFLHFNLDERLMMKSLFNDIYRFSLVSIVSNLLYSLSKAMFTTYRIDFRFVSQNYTVWCEHTFISTFMGSMNLKTLYIILMCFNGKNQPFGKYTREISAIVITKRYQKNQKLISFEQMMKYSFFFHRLSNSNFCCVCSRSASSLI